jgi:cytochrome c oxidase subunit 2
MSASSRATRRRLAARAAGAVAVALGAALAAAACARDGPSVMEPAGPNAGRINVLWWVMLVAGTVVLVIVLALLAVALRRRPADAPARPRPEPAAERRLTRMVVIGGAVAPAAILAALFLLTLSTLGALAAPGRADELVVEVTGKQFWWEVRYAGGAPHERFETANEIHIPVGQRVRLRLRASDVIHSLWVPALAGKMDLIPGRATEMWIQADRPGVFRGQCAEFCGVQHANMGLLVVARPPDDFARWAAAQRRPAAEPPDDAARRGRERFLDAGCALCHAIRGTPAGGDLGPGLTHVGARRTLAANTIPNTRGHLGGWIADPQGVKPGSRMPAVPLRPQEFHQIVRYLETLR